MNSCLALRLVRIVLPSMQRLIGLCSHPPTSGRRLPQVAAGVWSLRKAVGMSDPTPDARNLRGSPMGDWVLEPSFRPKKLEISAGNALHAPATPARHLYFIHGG